MYKIMTQIKSNDLIIVQGVWSREIDSQLSVNLANV